VSIHFQRAEKSVDPFPDKLANKTRDNLMTMYSTKTITSGSPSGLTLSLTLTSSGPLSLSSTLRNPTTTRLLTHKDPNVVKINSVNMLPGLDLGLTSGLTSATKNRQPPDRRLAPLNVPPKNVVRRILRRPGKKFSHKIKISEKLVKKLTTLKKSMIKNPVARTK
jgi:hypothetical protein